MNPSAPLLLKNVELNGVAHQDVLITDGRITAIGQQLVIDATDAAEIVEGEGGALLPSLNDHHIHLAALAVSQQSVQCSPNLVRDEQELAALLRQRATEGQWLRGIGYHPSVAGEIDATWLDQHGPDVPIRIQHQGGRLWVLNSAAISRLQVKDDDPLERVAGELTGRLYEGDVWLRKRMQSLGESSRPGLAEASRHLARYGITGLTDTTPSNNRETLLWFASAQARGELLQDVLLMGDASLDAAVGQARVQVGAHKFHLLESELPDLEEVVQALRSSHSRGRNAAFHCVTRTELAFALAAFRQAGANQGDRIEHASVAAPEWLQEIHDLGLIVVTQPALIRERGDRYLRDVDDEDQPWLYRLRGFLDAGIPLAGSSDAPYTDPNPWLAMQAAVDRKTISEQWVGEAESVTPEEALALYTSPLDTPGSRRPPLQVGDRADLCLLSRPWSEVREHLAEAQVVLTLKAGQRLSG